MDRLAILAMTPGRIEQAAAVCVVRKAIRNHARYICMYLCNCVRKKLDTHAPGRKDSIHKAMPWFFKKYDDDDDDDDDLVVGDAKLGSLPFVFV